MDALNAAMTAALRDIMRRHGVTQRQVARRLDRSEDYVSGRLGERARHALSVDIIAAAASLIGMSDRALVRELMATMAAADTGQGSSER